MDIIKTRVGSVIGGALLIAGTCVGGGMLALPVVTSLAGFIPAIFIYVACWAFMACTALLLAEVCLFSEKGSNMISLAHRTLGPAGEVAAWVLYLFLFYSLLVAYVSGCGDLVVDLVGDWAPEKVARIGFVLFFSSFIYLGTLAIERLNGLLMVGLCAAFVAFLWVGAPHVEARNLEHQHWRHAALALPITFTAFAFQNVVPTLTHALKKDVVLVRWSILLGSVIPLICYLIWQWLILGIIPTHGPGGLAEALLKGQNAIMPLKEALRSPVVVSIGEYFALLALITSFLGVSLGLRDFLADGFHIKKNKRGRLLLLLMIFLPPTAISFYGANLFLSALEYAGGIGCALLLGLIPVLMAWRGRYHLGFESPVMLGGGKPVLVILGLFVLFELSCQAVNVWMTLSPI